MPSNTQRACVWVMIVNEDEHICGFNYSCRDTLLMTLTQLSSPPTVHTQRQVYMLNRSDNRFAMAILYIQKIILR